IETFERQRAAAEKQRTLSEAQAQAAMQTQLTNSHVQVQIAENQGEADLARARKQAEQTVVTAQAESQQRILAGRGEGARTLQIGLSEASVLLRKIGSFGDPRLYALSLVAEHLSHSSQPLVPERVFMAGGNGENGDAPSSARASGPRRHARPEVSRQTETCGHILGVGEKTRQEAFNAGRPRPLARTHAALLPQAGVRRGPAARRRVRPRDFAKEPGT